MPRPVKRLLQIGYFFLCYAPALIWAGHVLIGSWPAALFGMAATIPAIFVLSLLPGRVGGRNRSGPVQVRVRRGNDPDPDRDLRSEAVPLAAARRFPLRAAACAALMLAVAAIVTLAPIPALAGLWWLKRLALGAVLAALMPAALHMMAGEGIESHHGLAAGIALYALSGIAMYFAGMPELNAILLGLGVTFLVVTGLILNEQSLEMGIAAKSGARPSAAMRSRNRSMLIALAVVVFVLAMFDRLRDWTRMGAQAVLRFIGRVLMWFSNLFAGEETSTGGTGSSGDMFAGLQGGEPGAFWVFMEKVALAAGVLLLAVLLYLLLRKLGGALRRLFARISGYFHRFASAIGEEYQDERVSLLNWGDVQKSVGEGIRKRLNRLFAREKKWEQMDAREKVRFVVRQLYRRVDRDLSSLTIHESAGLLKLNDADPERVAQLYDRARYGSGDVAHDEAESMRREVHL